MSMTPGSTGTGRTSRGSGSGWPRWHGADASGRIVIDVSPLINPAAAAEALWLYGRWLRLLARYGGVFLSSQWHKGFGGGTNAAARAWADCIHLGVVGFAALDGSRRGARLGWLTRAGWHLCESYPVPSDRHAPSLTAARTVHALAWLQYAIDANVGAAPPSAHLPEACREHGVPEGVARSLTRGGARLGPEVLDLSHAGRIAYSVGRLGERRLALFAADGVRERAENSTRTWLRNLWSVRRLWPAPWRTVPVVVLAPGTERGHWWSARRRLWANNGWPPEDLMIVQVQVSDHGPLPLVF